MLFFKIFLPILHLIGLSLGANILALLGTDLHSHFLAVKTVLEHLSPYHNITFFVPNIFKYKHVNITTKEIYAPQIMDSINDARSEKRACKQDPFNMFYNVILNTAYTDYDKVYKHTNIQKIMKDAEEGYKMYDLLIINAYGSDHFYPLAHMLKIPFVQICPSMMFSWTSESVSNPYSFVSDFSFMIPDTSTTTVGRLRKFIKNCLLWYHFYWNYIPALNKIVLKYFPPGTPGIEKVIAKADLVFVNTHSATGYSRPHVPAVVEIGGAHIQPAKPLPAHIEEFIADTGDDGFIYFSLGTVVQESFLSTDKINMILNVIRKLKQKVLWKWNWNITNTPSNLMVSNWFPQKDIIGHKKIKLFITQGGILSMLEANYFGVPVLVIPLLFDQFTNARLAEHKGYGLSVDFCQFSEQVFYSKIKQLLENTSYKHNAEQISQVMKHEFPNPAEKINYWVDFVIRNNGTSVLRPIIISNFWMHTIPTDIFLVMIFSFSFLCSSLYFTYRFLTKTLHKYVIETKLKMY